MPCPSLTHECRLFSCCAKTDLVKNRQRRVATSATGAHALVPRDHEGVTVAATLDELAAVTVTLAVEPSGSGVDSKVVSRVPLLVDVKAVSASGVPRRARGPAGAGGIVASRGGVGAGGTGANLTLATTSSHRRPSTRACTVSHRPVKHPNGHTKTALARSCAGVQLRGGCGALQGREYEAAPQPAG